MLGCNCMPAYRDLVGGPVVVRTGRELLFASFVGGRKMVFLALDNEFEVALVGLDKTK